MLLQFEKPAPAELIAAAQTVAKTIDPALAWEFASEDEFGFADLAREYFNDKASTEQQAAALFCLFEAPHYFRRAGKGRFKKAPTEIVQQALIAIEKKKQLLLQIADWAQALADQSKDAELQARFSKLAKALTDNEAAINAELIGAQGKPVDMGGYYHPDFDKTSKAMRPSAIFNAALAAI